MTAGEQLGGEIRRAFEQIEEDETRVAAVLSLLPLRPIEELLRNRYKTWTYDGRLKLHPMAMIRAMLLKELKGIRSYQQLIAYLFSNPEESRLVGFKGLLPSIQSFSLMNIRRIDVETQQRMDFAVENIRKFAKENGRELDIEFLPVSNRRGSSRRTIQRHVSRQGGKVARYMKKVILPQLMLPSDDNCKYMNDDLVNALGYMAERQICANQGCDLMRNDGRFRHSAPHGRTLLGRLAQMHSSDIRAQSIKFFDTVFRMAKSHGLVPVHPVTLALDYTDIPYYGDTKKVMVVGGKPERGTYYKHRYAVIKISAKWGDLFLMALPIGVLTDQREAIRELIEFARQRVRIKHIVVDKGFFSSKYLSLFEEIGVKYLMPGVKNKRVVRLIKEGMTSSALTRPPPSR